jgi:gluconokinase
MLAIQEQIGTPAIIKATGGFASSPLWRQMLADIFDQPVSIPTHHESSCLGSCILGLHALGLIENLQEATLITRQSQQYEPNPQSAQIYKQLLPIFLSISSKLGPEYEAISEFQRQFTSS